MNAAPPGAVAINLHGIGTSNCWIFDYYWLVAPYDTNGKRVYRLAWCRWLKLARLRRG